MGDAHAGVERRRRVDDQHHRRRGLALGYGAGSVGAARAFGRVSAVTLRSVTQAGRIAAESLMADTCIIERPGDPELDRLTGDLEPAPTVVYIGKCRVQTWQPQEFTPEVAGHTASVQRYAV